MTDSDDQQQNGSTNTQPKDAVTAASQRDWPAYFAAVKGKPPRDTLLFALDRFDAERTPIDQRLAIDIAAGEGRDSAEMLRRGWRVHAIDGHPEAMDHLDEMRRACGVDTDRFTFEQSAMETYQPSQALLINASFCLPFCEPAHFDGLWERIRHAIMPGGRFAGQFFGDRHSWASIDGRTHHTKREVDVLLEGLDIELYDEAEKDGEDVLGQPVHWHVFHVVAKKP
ncbi:MAG: class I SAM-dependent methyltransferase [Phycisphaeraceae bacterium]|nr:class I SAM-dependent methyltransferase [Phycisphaerales bacterium]MCB9860840.1 class I SAM-dependent methyltransferase [Phycisphaeraceae bacterium]